MNKLKIMLLTVVILLSVLGSIFIEISYAQSSNDIKIEKYFINITTGGESFSVSEEILFNIENDTFSNKTVFIFVQESAESVKASISNKFVNLNKSLDGESYSINLSNYNISTNIFKLDIDYQLPYSANFIIKKILYPTGEIFVNLDDKLVFNSKNSLSNNVIKVVLSTEKEGVSLWYYITYIAVIALIGSIVILLVNYLKGKKYTKKGETETSEILELKKKLLLESLKELEKEYRSKKISEYVYNKVRDEFKSQAVNVMKKLEEIKK